MHQVWMGAVFEKEYGSVEWIKWKPNGEEFRNDRTIKEGEMLNFRKNWFFWITAATAGLYATMAAIFASWWRKEPRLGPRRLLSTLRSTGQSMLDIDSGPQCFCERGNK